MKHARERAHILPHKYAIGLRPVPPIRTKFHYSITVKRGNKYFCRTQRKLPFISSLFSPPLYWPLSANCKLGNTIAKYAGDKTFDPPPGNHHRGHELGFRVIGLLFKVTVEFIMVRFRVKGYYYYYYAAFNAPCVGHKDDESQAIMVYG